MLNEFAARLNAFLTERSGVHRWSDFIVLAQSLWSPTEPAPADAALEFRRLRDKVAGCGCSPFVVTMAVAELRAGDVADGGRSVADQQLAAERLYHNTSAVLALLEARVA